MVMENSKKNSLENISMIVKSALQEAQIESRLIIGLSECIKVLSKDPGSFLFCLMALPQVGDSATHMHEVLLEAFCYENDIYVIKVDSAVKLSRLLGEKKLESCALIQRTLRNDVKFEDDYTKFENILVDYCEEFWEYPQQPIVKLPAM